VVVEIPVSDLFREAYNLLFISLVLILVALLVMVYEILNINRKVFRPLIILQEGARKLGGGQLETKIEIKTDNEFETLALTFNEMASKLWSSYRVLEEKVRERTAELEAERGGLEQKIKERTKQLEELTGDLEQKIKERTKELQEKMQDLERFNKLAVGRELKMIELKKGLKEYQKKVSENNSNRSPG
jgi:nitrate/nitrite-specific signal transduction histidine kinase